MLLIVPDTIAAPINMQSLNRPRNQTFTTRSINRPIFAFMSRRKISKVAPDSKMNPKRQRKGSTDFTCSTATASSLTSVESGVKKITQRVQFLPMATVKEFKKYSEPEKQEVFLSRADLQQIKDREMKCIACKTNPSFYCQIFCRNTPLKDDLNCHTIKTFEEMRMRREIRQAVVTAVLYEQQFQRHMGVLEPLIGAKGCQLLTAVAEQQALERGMRSEMELTEP
jgi:hypothetical protein